MYTHTHIHTPTDGSGRLSVLRPNSSSGGVSGSLLQTQWVMDEETGWWSTTSAKSEWIIIKKKSSILTAQKNQDINTKNKSTRFLCSVKIHNWVWIQRLLHIWLLVTRQKRFWIKGWRVLRLSPSVVRKQTRRKLQQEVFYLQVWVEQEIKPGPGPGPGLVSQLQTDGRQTGPSLNFRD